MSSQPNRLLTSTTKKMLKQNFFGAADTIFTFLATSIDRVKGYIVNPLFTRVQATYYDIVNHLRCGSTGLDDSFALGFALTHNLEILSRIAKEIGALDDTILFTLKFYMPHHIAENLKKF